MVKFEPIIKGKYNNVAAKNGGKQRSETEKRTNAEHQGHTEGALPLKKEGVGEARDDAAPEASRSPGYLPTPHFARTN